MEERLYDLIFIARPATPEDETEEGHHIDRARLHGKRRKDREDRALGHAQARV